MQHFGELLRLTQKVKIRFIVNYLCNEVADQLVKTYIKEIMYFDTINHTEKDSQKKTLMGY